MVFPIQIWSIVAPIQVVCFSHSPWHRRWVLRHGDHATASAGSRKSSLFVRIAQICRAILLASAIPTSIFGLRASFRPIQLSAGTLWRARPTIRVIAPIIRSRRMSLWPAFEIRPSRALPPVECWRGTSPSQAAKARPDLNCAMSEANASIASAVRGPTPGIVCSRRAVSVSTANALRVLVFASIRSVFSAICASRSRHSAMMSSGRSQPGSSTPASIRFRWPRPIGNTWPYSYSIARSAFTSSVRWWTRRSRPRNSTALACCSAVFGATKRISGWRAAITIASASAASFFCRFTKGRTYCGAISLTSWPSAAISRAQ